MLSESRAFYRRNLRFKKKKKLFFFFFLSFLNPPEVFVSELQSGYYLTLTHWQTTAHWLT